MPTVVVQNRPFLYKGCTKGNQPHLINVEMQLRKCCNHPYLIAGVEDKENATASAESAGPVSETQLLERMICCSGKMVLIDKLLPKLHEEGHKVLMFSQMVRMLDMLEYYCRARGYKFERLDGGVRGDERQASIDRFTKSRETFVFLLSTRAGGVGINLTAADTVRVVAVDDGAYLVVAQVVFFDSDWNPQNDSQAAARCHRIGQTQAVKIYRLLTRNTYEATMFDRASKKLAIEMTVLGANGPSIGGGRNEQRNPQELEDLLRRGAYGFLADSAGDDAARVFCESNIQDLLAVSVMPWCLCSVVDASFLQRNTRTLQVESAHGFSVFKSAFAAASSDVSLDVNAADFWERVLPDLKSPEKLRARLEDGSAAADPGAFFADVESTIRAVAAETDEMRDEGREFALACELVEQIAAMPKSFGKVG